jgi:hypothetical protein
MGLIPLWRWTVWSTLYSVRSAVQSRAEQSAGCRVSVLRTDTRTDRNQRMSNGISLVPAAVRLIGAENGPGHTLALFRCSSTEYGEGTKAILGNVQGRGQVPSNDSLTE